MCSVREIFRLRVGDLLDLGLDEGWNQITALVVRVTSCAALVQPVTESGKPSGHPFRISSNSEVPILSRGGALAQRNPAPAPMALPEHQNALQPRHRRDMLRSRRRSPCSPAKTCPTHLPTSDCLWEDPTQSL